MPLGKLQAAAELSTRWKITRGWGTTVPTHPRDGTQLAKQPAWNTLAADGYLLNALSQADAS